MQLDDVLKLDIKLLVAFVTIVEEGNVSRSAKKLGVTQPALSKSLQKLRELFNDTLFTRQAYGLVPTTRATELYDLIRPILHSLSEVMNPNTLVLENVDRRFKLRVDEGDLGNFIEPLLKTIQQQAPSIKLSMTAWGDSQFDELTSGNVDLGIRRVSNTPSNIRSKLIGYMDACIVLGELHPLFNQHEASLAELLNHNFVTHYIASAKYESTFTKTEQKLKVEGYEINPTLETDSLMVAMQAVKQGMALVTSRSIGELFLEVICEKTDLSSVRLLPIPKEVLDLDEYKGRHPIYIFWHERFNNDLAHRWLREQIVGFMRESPWIHPPS